MRPLSSAKVFKDNKRHTDPREDKAKIYVIQRYRWKE